MLTMLLYVLIVGLVAALLFLVASAVFGRGEELGPLPEGTTETVLPAEDIRGDDVRELRFQQVFRGYKVGEVDWALARLAARIDELEGQLASARGETSWNTGTFTASAQHQHAASPQPSAMSSTPVAGERTVRTERRDTPEDARTVRTERHETRDEPPTVRTERQGDGDTPTAQRDPGTPDITDSAAHPAVAPTGSPQHGTGLNPWSGIAATGPWEVSPTTEGAGVGPGISTPAPHPASWTGPLPAALPTPTASGTGTYAPVPEVSRVEHTERPSSLSLPPITTTSGLPQPPAPPTETAQWPDTANTAGQSQS